MVVSSIKEHSHAKNVVLAASLPPAADKLFDMYLDTESHAAITVAPMIIEPHAGAAFRAFNGLLCGMILHVNRTAHRANLALGYLACHSHRLGLMLSFWPRAMVTYRGGHVTFRRTISPASARVGRSILRIHGEPIYWGKVRR